MRGTNTISQHILLLDEPTNHLDMESIDALAKAVNEFDGGMVLVSHDMRLISQVAKEIWICDNKTVERYKGDILSFKMDMRAQMDLHGEQKGQLRGDASTLKKEGDKPKPKPAKKAEPKLEVIKPKATAAPAPAPAPKSTFNTDGMKESLPETATAAAPAKKRYIPPHLRKKMAEEQG